MSDESAAARGFTLKRREFLSSAALPIAAALAPSALLAQERGTAAVPAPIRVGIIGAGGIVSSVHVPGLKRQPGVELVSVANRSLDSSRRAAGELGIRNAYANWEELLAAGGLDAVLIGTWPYMHKAITLAALDQGLHVLCQARMANDAAEARDMLAASQRHPLQICQLVPSSGTYRIDRALQRLLGERFVGDLLSVDVQMLQRGFASFEGELDWRHDAEFSGINVLNVGGTYESAMRWLGSGNRVMAMTRVQIPTRRDGDGRLRNAAIPDHVEVLYELANGAPVHMKFSETTGLSAGNQIWIFGSEGTIYVDDEQKIFVGKRGDTALAELENPREQQAAHRVEEEFINAIRGRERVSMNTFEIGVRYMEWTEAIYRSARSGAAVELPLA
ncbi:MAG TPA: Gfo/Idh/MocA family oxidoreductase [Gammaproteobacteria bacterium]|nr:Gfo/Idh/MocA family oxidoreductase [Gammaproteobacteria bacterium]